MRTERAGGSTASHLQSLGNSRVILDDYSGGSKSWHSKQLIADIGNDIALRSTGGNRNCPKGVEHNPVAALACKIQRVARHLHPVLRPLQAYGLLYATQLLAGTGNGTVIRGLGDAIAVETYGFFRNQLNDDPQGGVQVSHRRLRRGCRVG